MAVDNFGAFLTELTWQVLIEGYLTSLVLVNQSIIGFSENQKSMTTIRLGLTRNVKLAQLGTHESVVPHS